jgi:peptidoglycan/xylan/chitin deacetylase (PgdA/CDA1 family)
MSLPAIGTLQRVFRRAARSLSPRALILLYHRVAVSSPDPQLLCVTPAHFGEHLEVLRKYGDPIALRSLLPALQNGQCPRRAIGVTFDDGYVDNLHHAKPLLERYDVPATVFVTSGYVGSEKEFWYDDLERLLLQPGILPKTLRLNVNGTLHQWQLNGAVHYDKDSYCSYAGWNISRQDNPTQRHELYRSLFQTLLPLPDKQRRKLVDDLLIAAGVETSGRPTHRILSPEEMIQLTEGELVEVGSHTVSHPILSTLPTAAQAAEISQSKARLEEILGDRVSSFAYPYGGRSHYTDETVAAVRQAGFECACAAFPGIVRQAAERWQLPRFVVRDWDGEEFAHRLSQWFRS